MIPLTHASFFSGVGGMDLGLEMAGWQTVSFSEIEPYACAVLNERWPDVPNLGDITRLTDVPAATIWTGGFPCQDLSTAGRRAGFDGKRSVLAFTFLDLVERHRPHAFVLENVPGLFSSNAGRDFGRLLREVGELGYWWAYRVLDLQWFGVPQRRRRVFVVAIDARRYPDPDCAAKVLAVRESCGRDHQAEREAWSKTSGRTGRRAEIVRQAISSKWSKQSAGPSGDEHHHLVYGEASDTVGMRTPTGMAGWMDTRQDMGGTQAEKTSHAHIWVKSRRAQTQDDFETWVDGPVMPTLNQFDVSDTRATALIAGTLNMGTSGGGGPRIDAEMAADGKLVLASHQHDDDLLPDGYDTARYKAIGNGVAAPVANWIGSRLRRFFEQQGDQV